MPAACVGVKDRRTHPGMENGVYSPILHPYEPNPPNLHHGNVILMMWFIYIHRLFEIRMVITQLLNDEMVINSSHIDGISVIFSPSGHNDGSPINQIHHHGNGFLMMWFIRFQRLFKIRMVITQSLNDERIKISRNIDGISVILFPFRA